MTYADIKALVSANNNSKIFSDEFVICLIWKETNFEPSAVNPKTGTTGLMQMGPAAVKTTNENTPKGIHFEYSEMTDPIKNVQCGTYYLDIAVKKLSGVDVSFGTGKGYSNNIRECEKCMKKDKNHPMVALHKIHK